MRGKSDIGQCIAIYCIVTNILYWLFQQYQYIVLVATCIAIYCIHGNVYCNIFIVRLRNHQYNNDTIVRIPAMEYMYIKTPLRQCTRHTGL
jgi:hypothetical protein